MSQKPLNVFTLCPPPKDLYILKAKEKFYVKYNIGYHPSLYENLCNTNNSCASLINIWSDFNYEISDIMTRLLNLKTVYSNALENVNKNTYLQVI